MKNLFVFFLLPLIGLVAILGYIKPVFFGDRAATSQEGLPVVPVPDDLDPRDIIGDWKRPDVPAKVGIQVGHMDNDEVPDELHRLRGNTGAQGGGYTESEVAYKIALETASILEANGVEVDILPATVPEKYWADVFISIHADGSEDPYKTGYKFSGPRRDYTGKADKLVALLEEKYEAATGLDKDPNITRNMRGYYAFSWWRYNHAIHPMTTGIIAETGFMTNYSDRRLLVNSPEIPAKALADALIEHLIDEGLLVNS